MPCAKKLLREVHECIADEERGHPALVHSGLGVHCARLKYIRSSEAACNVYAVHQLEMAGAKEVEAMREMQIKVKEQNTELIRQLQVRLRLRLGLPSLGL